MAQGFELKETEDSSTGAEKKVRLTSREVARFKGSVDIEGVAALLRKKMGATLKPPYVGVFGVGKSSTKKKGAQTRELAFQQGDTWLSIQDDDGTWYTYDWGNNECCQKACAGSCE